TCGTSFSSGAALVRLLLRRIARLVELRWVFDWCLGGGRIRGPGPGVGGDRGLGLTLRLLAALGRDAAFIGPGLFHVRARRSASAAAAPGAATALAHRTQPLAVRARP